MDPQVAEAVLEFADDLRAARGASGAWAKTKGLSSTGSRRTARMRPESEEGARKQTAAGQD
jgi:hypothetical protein